MLSSSKPPRRLYKFLRSTEALKHLLRGELKFTPIDELNDPSELRPLLNISEVEKSRDHYRLKGYSSSELLELQKQEKLFRLAPGHQVVPVPPTVEAAKRLLHASAYDDLRSLENKLGALARDVSAKVGLLCLTDTFSSLPMWAHYANNAAGFVVEFTDLHLDFPGDATGLLNQVEQVQYGDDLPGVTFDPTSFRSLFFSKLGDWQYEREYRVVLPLSSCQQVSVDASTLHIFRASPERVTSVFAGWRCHASEVEAVADQVARSNSSVRVAQARFGRGKIDLEPWQANNAP